MRTLHWALRHGPAGELSKSVLDLVERGETPGAVEQARSARCKLGDIVIPGAGAWESHTISADNQLATVRQDVPLTGYLSVLGPISPEPGP